MRSRLILLGGAALLAATHVTGVLLGSPVWPPALVATFVLLAVYAAGDGRPRWAGPVALAPLILQAALTVPRVRTGDYAWFVTTFTGPPTERVVLDALDAGFRSAGALLLFAAVLLITLQADKSDKSVREARVRAAPDPSAREGGAREGGAREGGAREGGAREGGAREGGARESASGGRAPMAGVAGMVLAGLVVLAYAVTRVVALDHRDETTGAGRFAAAAVVPVVFGLIAAALAAVAVRRRRRWAGFGAFLLLVSALPMIDSALEALPTPYGVFRGGDPTRLFGWDLITPSISLPGPVPALTAALQLAGCLLLIGTARR